jgi:uncharacterized protein (DUF362 family)
MSISESKFAEIRFRDYDHSVPEALSAAGAREVLARQRRILLKPNLVNSSPPPITTPPECVGAMIDYVKLCTDGEVVIGEGCGDQHLETDEIFRRLGYDALAEEKGVELVDLNHAPLRKLENPKCPVFPEMYLPEIVFTHFLVSVPVLKAHSLAEVTGTLKNMIGLAPPEHYSGKFGSWKKAVFHGEMQQAIVDLNRYRTPDLTLMDATVGMAEYHLGGAHCDPPLNRILCGFDPVEIDRRGAELLGLDWKSIDHLR